MRSALVSIVLALAACSSPPAAPVGKSSLSGAAKLGALSDSSGIVVTLAGPTSSSQQIAGSGAFTFSSLLQGSYTVIATAPSTLEGTLAVPVSVPASGQATAATLTFTPEGLAQGSVTVNGASSGNGGILVAALGSSAAAVTDDGGKFSLTLPVGKYTLVATRPGGASGTAQGVLVSYEQSTAVPPIDLETGPSALATSVTGNAFTLGQPPGAGTQVTLLGADGGVTLQAQTGAGGDYTLPEVPPGSYSLAFQAPGGESDAIPDLLVVPGVGGLVVSPALYPLLPFEIPLGRRLLSDPSAFGPLSSPDGQTLLAFGDYDEGSGFGALWAFPVAAGGHGALLATGVSGTATPAVTPDGGHVLFSAPPSPGAPLSLYEVASAGGTPSLLSAEVAGWALASSGGFVVVRTAGQALVSIPLVGGGSPVTLSAGPIRFGPSLSPDGTHLLYEDSTGTLFVAAIDGSSSVNLGSAGPSAAISPDGQKVVFASTGQPPSLLEVGIGGGTPTTIATAASSTFTITPDSARVVYQTSGSLDVTPIAAMSPTVLSPNSYISSLAFSPDGAYVAFVSGDSNAPGPLMLATLATGATATVDQGAQFGEALFAPGGKSLAYLVASSGSAGTLKTVPIPVAGALPTTISTNAAWPAIFSPDGSTLAFLQGSVSIVGADGSTHLGTGTLMTSPVGAPTLTEVNDHVRLGTVVYAGSALASVRDGTPAPYGFQDGLYLMP
ncbi:MAG: carboxypeptidase regulatory-like domain-containing protein [Deltaproteobacteria bacterium]